MLINPSRKSILFQADIDQPAINDIHQTELHPSDPPALRLGRIRLDAQVSFLVNNPEDMFFT